jgi:hypothetical protein
MKRNLRNLELLKLKTGIYDPEWKQYMMLTKQQRLQAIQLLDPAQMASVIVEKLMSTDEPWLAEDVYEFD